MTLNRRQFLHRAAAAAVAAGFPAIIPASALGRDPRRPAPSNRIVLGCIGVGGQGLGNMGAFMNNEAVQVVAVCDVDEGRTRKNQGRLYAKQAVENYYTQESPTGSWKGCEAYNDFRDVLARPDIDAVSICTPDHWHAVIAVASAAAGKHMYCEKPLANSVSEGRAIVEAVRKAGVVLQTGSHERSRHSARYGCELVRNGRLGKIHTVRVSLPLDPHRNLPPEGPAPVPEGFDYNFWLGPAPEAVYSERRCFFFFRYIYDYAGGEMTDRGAHVLDLGQLALGMDDSGPTYVNAHGRAPAEGLFNTHTEFDFELHYPGGIRVFGTNRGERGITFEGTEGKLYIHIHGGELTADPPSLLTSVIGPGEVHLGRSPGHHQDFINAVRGGGEPMAPVEVGHRTASLCHLVNASLRTGKPLHWDPVAERVLDNPEAERLVNRPLRSPWFV